MDPSQLNAPDPKIGWTPLYRATICRNQQAVKALLDLNADPNVMNTCGQAPLMQSIEDGGGQITQLLLEANADPNFIGKDGLTPLHIAVKRNMTQVGILLLRKGANPNAADHIHRKTPLHFAAEFGLAKLTEVLISYEASPLILDSKEQSAMALAANADIQRILVEPPKPIDEETELSLATQPATERGSDVLYLDTTGEQPTKQQPPFLASPTASSNSQVLTLWLASIKLEEIAPQLLSAGYDDIEMMADQMKTAMPITHETLAKIGIEKPGHRARLLAHLIESGGKPIKQFPTNDRANHVSDEHKLLDQRYSAGARGRNFGATTEASHPDSTIDRGIDAELKQAERVGIAE